MINRYFIIAAALLLILCGCFFVSKSAKSTGIRESNQGYAWEKYDPSYFLKFQKISDIIDSADQLYPPSEQKSLAYFNTIADILRSRFFHGYSYYSYADNFFIAISGKLFWNDLSAIVLPDDIMKHPMAACSQQAIVLMEIFRRKGIDYRKIAFPHHFTVEGRINGEWEYFDTNLEPDFDNRRESLQKLLVEKRFDSIYRRVQHFDEYKKIMKTFSYGHINEEVATNAKIFHKVCFIVFSGYSLLAMLFLSMILFFNKEIKYIYRIRKTRLNYS